MIAIHATLSCDGCGAIASVLVTGAGRFGLRYEEPDGWKRVESWFGGETKHRCPKCNPRKR